MNIFDLAAKITLDSSGFDKGLSSAKGGMETTATKIKGGFSSALKVGATAIAGMTTAAVTLGTSIVKLASDTASYGDTIDKESQKIQTSAEQYQALSYAAEHSGFEMSVLTTAAKKLGSTDFDGNIYDALESVMALGTAEERTAMATELFGEKAAQQMQPLLQGSTTMSEYTKQLEALGGMMSNESVSASAKLEDSLTDLKTAFEGLKNNLMGSFLPSISSIMDGLSMLISGQDGSIEKLDEGISSFVANLSTTFSSVINTIVGLLPTAISGIGTIVSGLIAILPELIASVTDVISTTLFPLLIDMLPQLLSSGTDMLVSLINGIRDSIPMLQEAIPIVLETITTFINDNLPLIIESGISLLVAIYQGIAEQLPVFAEYIPTIVITLIDVLTQNLPLIISSAMQIIASLISGLTKAIPALIKYAPQIIKSIALALKGAMSEILNVGKNLVDGLWNGIKSKMSGMLENVKNFGKNILNGIKGVLGIASPSKKTKLYGKYLAEGLGIGFEDEIESVNEDIMDSLPTFDNIPSASISASVTSDGTGYNNLVDAFKMALAEMSVTMDGKEMGKFVNKTVTRAVYG